MNSKRIAEYYCSGCGLCERNTDKSTNSTNGFYNPEVRHDQMDECKVICPAFGNLSNYYTQKKVCGDYEEVWEGYSSDPEIRYHASSGGSLTSMSIYLIENGIVDGIIHSVCDPQKPWGTVTVCSTTKQELVDTCGSRYAQSAPLYDIDKFIEPGKKYAFIGKPCDAYSLRQYMTINRRIQDSVVIIMSFFCAGQPSELANQRLVKRLLGDEADRCVKLDYRGDGWPGKAKAVSSTGNESSINYEESWGRILGRDIRPLCRYCMVGLGEAADISCGDLWYLDENKKPSFNEGEGRNVIFGRTKLGSQIVKDAAKRGYLSINNYENRIEELSFVQPSQYDRKATMYYKILAMKLFGKPCPCYNRDVLLMLSKHSTRARQWEVFKGTVGRIIRKKI